MNVEFDILTTITFGHEYFVGGGFDAIDIRLSNETQSRFLGLGLMYKPTKSGFHILFDKKIAGRQRTREDMLKESLVCEFRLFLKDTGFFNYTAAVPADVSTSVYYFSNFSDDKKRKIFAGTLHTQGFVSEKDIFPAGSFKGQLFIKPFGILDLKIDEALQTAYAVKFAARSSYWRYILASAYLTGLNNPAVIGHNANQQFTGPHKLTLPNQKQALAFVSPEPIRLSRSSANSFQLVENYEPGSDKYRVVMRILPLPDNNLISHLPQTDITEPKKDYSEIIIH
ncbi:hypothetical protein [Mucilaginibacter polytrichastri]|uniref:Uncharacterized protein n=1 Tax=Mucilaginibacter polytrichastri TaxID=1302689 RepID=A0A1Q5ZXQ5_9SPHI|nr:hypothetical protein [Mucilaginibacter polytrichastri]OKS86522.1 hypothetical protein RG47T_1978 [Mucilaginibacter polytrichastri]SFS79475.1 hypothetical protein SAMN04487890_10496 [Mucilaginibacter polytrichastri]